MKKSADLHLHSNHSDDSIEKMENYPLEAIKKNIDIICYTDHVDFNPCDSGYLKYNPDLFWHEFNNLKLKYQNQVILLAGIEVGEPHLYPNEMKELLKYSYDYVLGAIHFWHENMFASVVAKTIPIKDAFNKYYDALLLMVTNANINAVAHFDFPKRYYKDLYFNEKLITSIIKIMIKKNIVLEINTSNLRLGLNLAMPDEEILEVYVKHGGKYVTFASDAHQANHLGEGIKYKNFLLQKYNLIEVYFKKQKMIILS